MVKRENDTATNQISAEIPDWSYEQPRRFWDPGRKLLLAMRRYQYWRNKGGFVALIACKWLILRHRFWSVVTGAEIPLNCNIGGGLSIIHPNGIVIHHEAKIGVNCLIQSQVTIGVRHNDRLPEIGGHVEIGTGAKIIGAVRIGDHAKIGANAVVIADVPAGATAVGVPAKIID
jgi:serine O-acetyltransferase